MSQELWDGKQPVVWVCNPSARPAAEVWAWLTAWIRRGYGACIYRDNLNDELVHLVKASGAPIMLLSGTPYPGYAVASNSCTREVFQRIPEARWAVCTGDDTEADPTWHPGHIALQLEAHFGNSTFGVMQPTGDPFSDGMGRIIERIAGSAWCGKQYCQRVNQGRGGPFHPGFQHMWGDNQLQETAKLLGVFLQRPDLRQEHHHFTRVDDHADWQQAVMPPHLEKWNTREHWNTSKALYDRLAATGFAECMPLEEVK